MIKLIFSISREVFVITLDNKIIRYSDRKFPEGVQFMPKDSQIERKVIMSRNRIPLWILKWVQEANTGKSLEEYQAAADDAALVPLIKRDAGSKGAIFLKEDKS